ncbi:nicotinic acid mononucleotide adenylyltransferase [Virgibacillus phasianinus]|uniref:Probable nicotinate-nucleotide adenylyltransferase n=1 Tax=Virgibacillus phasianinus TaxID=2017483 RepID=A0A220U4N8_9BACI|nr:nicotinate-nucleotide adenylyltransferase [Virgibacillus phasianinus]ASK63128.1 nicotinic acid mononucleotide adenylyltransferase [Virgibacillus phasianinus]
MRHVGILGGTFDPPHLGHLIIAEEVRHTLNLEEIWFVPSQEPPHKDKARTSAKQRVDMVQHAIECNPFFKLNTIEVNRVGKSYTIDTLTLLKKEHPDISFHFIIGADMVEYLPKWHKINELMNMVTFVGVKRVGFELEPPYPITLVDIPYIEISSTMIRERIETNIPVTYLLPEPVIYYIKEKRLYEE